MKKILFFILSLISLMPYPTLAQPDVVCKFADSGIPVLSNSVCRIRFTDASNKTVNCSGILINNENQDRRPYVLTSRHCITPNNFDIDLTTPEIAAAEASAQFIFRQRTTTCGGSTIETTSTYNGAIFRAANFYTDFALFEIHPDNGTLPADLNYAGWSRTDNADGNDLKIIAHPGGNPQKYGKGHKATVQSLDPWKYTVTWDEGASAANGGASGGALINGSNLVVGNLSYGNVGGQSNFGKFKKAWDDNSAANKQLKAWLSPNQNLSSIGPLIPMTFSSISNVCDNLSNTATLPNLGSGQTVTWSVSSQLSIVSSTWNSITVKAASSGGGGGVAQIFATAGPTSRSKDVYYGKPNLGGYMKYNGITANSYNYISPNTTYTIEYDQQKIVMSNLTSTMNWNPNPSMSYSYGINYSQYDINLSPGQTIQFNPISATNACGTENRSMAFQAYSSFALYPNPAVETVFLKFDNAKNLEGLPEDISIYEESSSKMVKYITLKDVFEKKMINQNVLAINVKDLPKGIYYVHVRPNKNNKVSTEKIRILIN